MKREKAVRTNQLIIDCRTAGLAVKFEALRCFEGDSAGTPMNTYYADQMLIPQNTLKVVSRVISILQLELWELNIVNFAMTSLAR